MTNSELFDSIWLQGPWLRLKREGAASAFKKTVRTVADFQRLQAAVETYRAHLERTPWKNPQNGDTFFRNWNDWVTFEEPAGRGCLRSDHPTAVCYSDGCRSE
jgi:hypothetical protein